MYIIVYHKITQPAEFWKIAQDALPNLPKNIRIHAIFPSEDMSVSTCLWETDSVESIRDFLQSIVGHVSYNEFQPVNQKFAMGLPESKF